jgi:hypothetical protein
LLNTLWKPFLVTERFLEILFTSDWFLLRVNKLQCEVTHYPHETREVLCILFWVCFLFDTAGLNLNVLGQVYDKTQLLQGVFIDATNAVIYEKTSKQNRKWEDPNVVVGIFVQSAKTLGVENQNFDRLTVGSGTVNRLSPDPYAL